MADVAKPAINYNAGKKKREETTSAAAGAAASTGKSAVSSTTQSQPSAAKNTNKVGDSAMLGNGDQATINRLTEQWNAAMASGNTALADSIHQQAEAIRANYGYSGGADGSGFIAVPKPVEQQMPMYEAESLESYLQEMYAAQAAAAEAQLKAAYDRNVGALDEAQKNIPQIYRSARNRTAAESAVAGANFNEYAAASGLGSGSGTQAQLARSNALLGGLTAIDQQEANALAEIEAERTQLMQQYQTAITEAKAQNKAALADALYSEMLRLQQEYADYADKQMQWQYQLQQDQYARQLNEAKLAAQYGDKSGLYGMGILTATPETPRVYTPSPVTPVAPVVDTPVVVPTVDTPATGFDQAKVNRLIQQYRGFSRDSQITALESLMANNRYLMSDAELQAIMDALGI